MPTQKSRKLSVCSYASLVPNENAPALLFIHGGYADSRYWSEHFIPYFNAAGFDCFTVDLSGHGKSSGKNKIDEFGLADYCADVKYALDRICRPTIAIGHSMGAVALQRQMEIGHDNLKGAVLMSPVPPSGTANSAISLAMKFPLFYHYLDSAQSGKISDEGLNLLAKIYFSDKTPLATVARLMPQINRESSKAIMEMAMPALRPFIARPAFPVLVVGGDDDKVFPASMLYFTAFRWNGTVHRVPEAGHMLPLEHNWETIAAYITGWIQQAHPERKAA